MPLGTEIGLGPEDIMLDGDPAPSFQKRGQSPLPIFRPMSILAKLLDGSRWHLGVGASRASLIIVIVFVRPLQVAVRPMLRDRCPVCLVCNVGALKI